MSPLAAPKGSRKLKAAMTALWMTFVVTILLAFAAWQAGVLIDALSSIVTLFLGGSGGALAIFTAGNATVHVAGKDPEA